MRKQFTLLTITSLALLTLFLMVSGFAQSAPTGNFTPKLVAQWGGDENDPDIPHLAVGDNVVYAVSHIGDLFMLQDALPIALLPTSSITDISPIRAIAVSGTVGYFAFGDVFATYDLSDPFQPTPIATTTIESSNYKTIYLDDHYAYLSTTHSGLQIIDISDPTQPNHIATHTAFNFSGAASGNIAIAGNDGGRVDILDVSNPTMPNLLTTISLTDTGRVSDIVVSDTLAYVSQRGHILSIIDFSDPSNATIIGAYEADPNISFGGMGLKNQRLYVTSDNSLHVYDVSNPNAPQFIEQVAYPLVMNEPQVEISGDFLYVAAHERGILAFQLTNLETYGIWLPILQK